MSALPLSVQVWLFVVWPGVVVVGIALYLYRFDAIAPVDTKDYENLDQSEPLKRPQDRQ